MLTFFVCFILFIRLSTLPLCNQLVLVFIHLSIPISLAICRFASALRCDTENRRVSIQTPLSLTRNGFGISNGSSSLRSSNSAICVPKRFGFHFHHTMCACVSSSHSVYPSSGSRLLYHITLCFRHAETHSLSPMRQNAHAQRTPIKQLCCRNRS